MSCQSRTRGLRGIGKTPPVYTVRRYTVRRPAGPVHGAHRPRVSYYIDIEHLMESIVATGCPECRNWVIKFCIFDLIGQTRPWFGVAFLIDSFYLLCY